MAADPKLKKRIKSILENRFSSENDRVLVGNGYHSNVHVTVISSEFSGKREKEKQDLLWAVIDGSSLPEKEKLKISLILPLAPEEADVEPVS